MKQFQEIFENVIIRYTNIISYSAKTSCIKEVGGTYKNKIESETYFISDSKKLFFVSQEIDSFQGGEMHNKVVGKNNLYLSSSYFVPHDKRISENSVNAFLTPQQYDASSAHYVCNGNNTIISFLLGYSLDFLTNSSIVSENQENGVPYYVVTQYENYEQDTLDKIEDTLGKMLIHINKHNKKIDGFDKKTTYFINKSDYSIIKIKEEHYNFTEILNTKTTLIENLFDDITLIDKFNNDFFS
ncbi:MAG: hypothetical protein EAZ95_10460 [Bacteroidetes bacterium]|nr:MAG: hypothetical protein EAZ95_10460 [Bacteroidota bacterium]